MNNYELGFDFSRLQTCQISRKKTIFSLVMLILIATFLPIAIVFYVLYLNKVPIEINDVLMQYTDSLYKTTILSLVSTMFGLSLLFFVLFLLSNIIKPKPFIIVDRDTNTFDQFYYVFDTHKKQEIYLTEKFAIIYNEKFDNVEKEDDADKIKELFSKYIFWHKFMNKEDVKVVHKSKKTIIKTVEKNPNVFYGNKLCRYSFSNDFHIVPEKIVELISYGRYGSSSYQSRNVFLIENVNQTTHLNINNQIKKVLQGLT